MYLSKVRTSRPVSHYWRADWNNTECRMWSKGREPNGRVYALVDELRGRLCKLCIDKRAMRIQHPWKERRDNARYATRSDSK